MFKALINLLGFLVLLLGTPVLAVVAMDCYLYMFLMVGQMKPSQQTFVGLRWIIDRPWAWAIIIFTWLLILGATALQKTDE